jgi:hypothetical protein
MGSSSSHHRINTSSHHPVRRHKQSQHTHTHTRFASTGFSSKPHLCFANARHEFIILAANILRQALQSLVRRQLPVHGGLLLVGLSLPCLLLISLPARFRVLEQLALGFDDNTNTIAPSRHIADDDLEARARRRHRRIPPMHTAAPAYRCLRT